VLSKWGTNGVGGVTSAVGGKVYKITLYCWTCLCLAQELAARHGQVEQWHRFKNHTYCVPVVSYSLASINIFPSCSMKRSFFPRGATAPRGPGLPHYRDFTITFRHTALGKIPLDEWSAHRRDLYLATHYNYKRQTSMPPVVFKLTIPEREWPQTHGLNRAATGIWSAITVNNILPLNYVVLFITITYCVKPLILLCPCLRRSICKVPGIFAQL
jgi:hypothetical protein